MTVTRSLAESLESRVLSFIREHELISGQARLLVAVSGGQDSVCLFDILGNLQAQLKVKLHVAHLNHQLRGADSDADAQYVTRLAEKMGVPATVEKRDVRAYQSQHRLSPEEAAREVRYAFLAEVARSIGTDRVAVAHTGDDHIETILMHLIRGSGAMGLRGLQPVTTWCAAGERLVVVRPLLTVTREETGDYCRSRRLMLRLDASNLSLSPLRNRIRLELLPLLSAYNPGIADALQRTSHLAGEVMDYLDEECRRLWDGLVQPAPVKSGFLFRKAAFLGLPVALQRHLLRLAIERTLSSLKDIESRHIEQIVAFLKKPAGRRLSLPDGLTFAVDYDHYFLGSDIAALCPFPPLDVGTSLKIPGQTRLPGWRITVSLVSREEVKEMGSDFMANLDFEKTGDRLTVRAREPGDWFQPLGLGQPKKLGRFMIDARIPQSWRERVPIVASPEQLVWVAGWRIDDRVKITESTRKVLRLEFEAEAPNPS